MGKAYVSEFTIFIKQYLQEHPEVVEDQRRGWNSFWNRKANLSPSGITKEGRVPNDSYGYSWSAWRAESLQIKKPVSGTDK